MNNIKNSMLKYRKKTRFHLFIIFVMTLIAFTVIITASLMNFVVEFDFLDNFYVCLGIAAGVSLLLAWGIIAYLADTATAIKNIGLESDSRQQIISALENPVAKAVTQETPVATSKTPVKGGAVAQKAVVEPAKPEVKTNLRPTLSAFDFKFIDKNTAIEAIIKSYDEQNIVVPQVHNGFPVRSVSTSVTDPTKMRMTETVYFPKSIRTIGDDVFANVPLLKSVVINDGVTKIGNNAFLNCQRLTEVYIPSSVQTCGANAFRGCPLIIIKLAQESKPAGFDIQYKDSQTVVVYKASR